MDGSRRFCDITKMCVRENHDDSSRERRVERNGDGGRGEYARLIPHPQRLYMEVEVVCSRCLFDVQNHKSIENESRSNSV